MQYFLNCVIDTRVRNAYNNDEYMYDPQATPTRTSMNFLESEEEAMQKTKKLYKWLVLPLLVFFVATLLICSLPTTAHAENGYAHLYIYTNDRLDNGSYTVISNGALPVGYEGGAWNIPMGIPVTVIANDGSGRTWDLNGGYWEAGAVNAGVNSVTIVKDVFSGTHVVVLHAYTDDYDGANANAGSGDPAGSAGLNPGGSGFSGSGNTGSGNSGSGNSGSGLPGSGNAGSGNSGSGNSGSGLPGSGNAGSGLPGSGNSGSGLPGSGNSGSGLPGSGNSGSGLPGSGNSGSGLPGSGNSGSGLPGSGNSGSGLPGSGNSGSGLPGSGNSGSGLPGSGNSGSGLPGSGNSGSGLPGSGNGGSGNSGSGLPGSGNNGSGFPGSGNDGSGKKDPDSPDIPSPIPTPDPSQTHTDPVPGAPGTPGTGDYNFILWAVIVAAVCAVVYALTYAKRKKAK